MVIKIIKPENMVKIALISLLFAMPTKFFHDPITIPKIIILSILVALVLMTSLKLNTSIKLLIIIWLLPLATILISITDDYNFFLNFFGDYNRGFGIYLTVLCSIFTTYMANQPLLNAQLILRYFFITAMIITMYQSMQLINLDLLGIGNAGTAASLAGNTNMSSVLVATFSLSLLASNQIFLTRTKFWASAGLLIFSLSILQFKTQQGFLVLLVGMVTYIFYRVTSKLEVKKYLSTSIYFIFWVVGILVLYKIMLVTPLFSFLDGDGNYSRRVAYWKAGMEIFKERPIFGIGMNGFLHEYTKNRGIDSILRDGAAAWVDTPHSVPVQMLSNGGLLLFTSWAIFILAISFTALKNYQSVDAAKRDLKNTQLAILCIWFGFCAQFLVSIWEISIIITLSILSGLILNQRFRIKSLELENSQSSSKFNFMKFFKINISVFFLCISIYLTVTQVIFANYVNQKNEGDFQIMKIVKHYPNYILLDQLANSDIRKVRVNEAIELEKLSVKLNPVNSRGYYQIGISYRYLGQLLLAQDMFITALKFDQYNVFYLEQLVRVQVDLGELAQAKENYDRILYINNTYSKLTELKVLIDKGSSTKISN